MVGVRLTVTMHSARSSRVVVVAQQAFGRGVAREQVQPAVIDEQLFISQDAARGHDAHHQLGAAAARAQHARLLELAVGRRRQAVVPVDCGRTRSCEHEASARWEREGAH